MPRKKKPIVEIVPASQAALVPKPSPANIEAIIERMVWERVDEILAERGAAEMEPNFQPREISTEIRLRQSVYERRKWSIYFEKWGCKVCGNKKVSHVGSGSCERCYMRVYQRLAQIKHDFDKANPESEIKRDIDQITKRVRSAQALLGHGEK